MTLYTLEAEANKGLAASINDGLIALARGHPDKFSCMATVPLQDPSAVADELGRAKKTGHIGVMIISNVAGMNLNDRSLDVFWAKVSELISLGLQTCICLFIKRTTCSTNWISCCQSGIVRSADLLGTPYLF